MSKRTRKRARVVAPPDPHAEALVELGNLVGELVDRVDVSELYDYRPTSAARSTQRRWTTHEPSLLTQLRDSGARATRPKPGPLQPVALEAVSANSYRLTRYASADATAMIEPARLPGIRYDGNGGKGGKPNPRAAADLQALDLYAAISSGALDLRDALRSVRHLHAGPVQAVEANLREVVGLVATEDLAVVKRALRLVRGWATAARVQLTYDAPVATIRDVVCHECGGRLQVRADASSDVWCAGGQLLEGPAASGERWPLRSSGCGTTYPRTSWVLLLAQREDTGS